MRCLRFESGAEATLFSGANPGLLRGPEHHLAWCDELAKWARPQETWDMLQLGLRLGERPRTLVTTTPRPGPVLTGIIAQPGTVLTGGRTAANPHLPAAYQSAVEGLYGGTRLGRQELEGELLTNAAGALWTVELIERCRVVRGCGEASAAARTERSARCDVEGRLAPTFRPTPLDFARDERGPSARSREEALLGFPPGERPLVRVVIGVDPPSGDGTCGIVACGLDGAGQGHVLADHSVTGRSPEGWARAVADAAAVHGRETGCGAPDVQIVAEANQGGHMVAAVLRTADPNLRVRLVTAAQSKSARAEPVAMLFEAGEAWLHGRMPALEAELLGLIAGGGYEGPGPSPDRADAMVWALGELMLGRRGAPRVLKL
jgi:phage terminase large subunit-like protein